MKKMMKMGKKRGMPLSRILIVKLTKSIWMKLTIRQILMKTKWPIGCKFTIHCFKPLQSFRLFSSTLLYTIYLPQNFKAAKYSTTCRKQNSRVTRLYDACCPQSPCRYSRGCDRAQCACPAPDCAPSCLSPKSRAQEKSRPADGRDPVSHRDGLRVPPPVYPLLFCRYGHDCLYL